MGLEPPNSKSDDSNDGKRSSAGRGGDSEDVEAADSTASVKTGTSQKTKRHPHHYNINANGGNTEISTVTEVLSNAAFLRSWRLS